MGKMIVTGWLQPRLVDGGRKWWMDTEIREDDGIVMVRYGRVSWRSDGTGYYDVSVTFEREGFGFYCFPDFRALSDAQDYVDRLMVMTLDEVKQENGRLWPGVVI